MAATTANRDFDLVIVGGGLAGLVCAIEFGAAGKRVLLIEKKTYPYHKVCGEYISNEVLSYLQHLGFDPFAYGATRIDKLRISTPQGKNIRTHLDLGGFGISRYTMDYALYQLAQKKGAIVLTNTRVTNIKFLEDHFIVSTNSDENITARMVVGSYGKRDVLDKKLNRAFIHEHTGYLGVKYHIKTDYPSDEIGLDNFDNGYCGISKVEDETYNMCYLYKRPKKKSYKTIAELEENILYKNPVLKQLFTSSDFLFPEPEVINEISFAQKTLIEDHIFMCGDSAGLITPLCGNGMSMAIGSAKILCDLILKSNILDTNINMKMRVALEQSYKNNWTAHFSNRLFWGRTLQHIFGSPVLTGLSINAIHTIPSVEKWLLRRTHGQPIYTDV